MSELPNGWEKVPIGDVCKVVGGSTPKTTVEEYWGGDVPWITPNDLSGHDGKYINRGERSLTESGYGSCSTTLMPAGSVLFSSRAPIGYVAIAANPVCTNQGFKSFVPSSAVRSDYLYWYLRFAAPDIRQMGSGTTFSEISGKVAKTIPVVLPPLEEQQRIVEAIEEQFSRLDAGVESLQRAKRNLTRLRASILKAAVEGQLSRESAAAEKLASSDGPYPIPAGWKWECLEVVAEVSGGIQKQPKRLPRDNAYSYLRVANVLRDRIDLADVHEMQLFGGELGRYRLEVGDLLVVEGNGSQSQIGRSAVWRGEIENCVHQNHIIRVRPGRRLVPRFLNLYWNSPNAIRRITEVAASTSGLYTLSTSKVKAVPVPIPPIATQHTIVTEVERQFSILDAMAETIGSGLQRTHGLRQAILRDAFSGYLVRA